MKSVRIGPFRSITELTWAMLFEKKNIEWHYEPFLISDSQNCYLPDFLVKASILFDNSFSLYDFDENLLNEDFEEFKSKFKEQHNASDADAFNAFKKKDLTKYKKYFNTLTNKWSWFEVKGKMASKVEINKLQMARKSSFNSLIPNIEWAKYLNEQDNCEIRNYGIDTAFISNGSVSDNKHITAFIGTEHALNINYVPAGFYNNCRIEGQRKSDLMNLNADITNDSFFITSSSNALSDNDSLISLSETDELVRKVINHVYDDGWQDYETKSIPKHLRNINSSLQYLTEHLT